MVATQLFDKVGSQGGVLLQCGELLRVLSEGGYALGSVAMQHPPRQSC